MRSRYSQDDVFLDGSGTVYLAHFGRLSEILSRAQIPISDSADTFELRYIAPEFLAPTVDAGASRSSKAGDIYSFGCLMVQLCSRAALKHLFHLIFPRCG
jgi:serine/threonine protein kinase